MWRGRRPHCPGSDRPEEGRGEPLKHPRNSEHAGEPKGRSSRKQHHGNTYQRCHQMSRRMEQQGRRAVTEGQQGSLVMNNHGKEGRDPDRGGGESHPHEARQTRDDHHQTFSLDSQTQQRSSTQHASSRANLTPLSTQQDFPHTIHTSSTQHNDSHTIHTSSTQNNDSHTIHTSSLTQFGIESQSRSQSPSSSCSADDDDGGGGQQSSHRMKRRGTANGEEGHLVYHTGLVLKERYDVVSTLGEGAFGKVVECIDRENVSERVALKIVKKIERFREAARSEIKVLEEIKSLDDNNRFACVRMLDWFDHHGHICIVFERLGLSTFDDLRENDFLPFTVEQIRHMAFQIFTAVSFLHRNHLTHTDLKPENILFVCSDYDLEYNNKLERYERKFRCFDVKVVDFGTATFDHEQHAPLVSTRHYRAPEVILDLGWSQACDVWSLGCTLMEFYLGLTLFQTHDSKEHLAMMERVLGPIPRQLLSKTRKHSYVHRGHLDWDEHSCNGRYVRTHCKPLKQYMQSSSVEHGQLLDLVGSMMEYHIPRRLSLQEALWHPFFNPLRRTHTHLTLKT